MSVCDTCPDPGRCCRDFPLPAISTEFWPTPLEVMIYLASIPYENPDQTRMFVGLPFVPIARSANGGDHWRFSCVNLLPDGRCGDYENRPYGPCVLYQPASDALCVLHNGET